MAAIQNYDEFLFSERCKALGGSRNISLLAEFGVMLATALVLSRAFAWQPILLWVVVAALASTFSWYTHRSVPNHLSAAERAHHLLKIVLGTFMVASAWGSVTVLFYVPNNTEYLILLIALYAGFVSGALAVTFAYSKSFIAFAFGISAPFLLQMLYQGEELHFIIALLILFYIAMLSYVSFNMQQLFVDNTKSSYKNLSLIEQLVEEKEIAEQATAAKNEFLAAASHDLRQPIHAANLFIDVLRPLQTNPANLQILDKIRQAMQGLNNMLHGLLDMSRLDASAVENEPQHISVNEIVAKLSAEQEPAVNSSVQVINNLPAATYVFADPLILERIVRNLFDNAAKYTTEGQISFAANLSHSQVTLIIEDTGMGIPQDKLETIFDEFTQLNNPERDRQKGLGLGLAIVQRLCRLADFEIDLKSTLSKGTKVSVTLPMGDHAQHAQVEVADADLNDLKVLVIDDEADIRDGMQTLLQSWGCAVIAEANLRAAELLLVQQEFTPQLLLVDFRLTDNQSGIDAIRHFRDRFGATLPAVLITGDTAPERVNLAQQSGAKVIYKPVDGATLRKTVQLVLGS